MTKAYVLAIIFATAAVWFQTADAACPLFRVPVEDICCPQNCLVNACPLGSPCKMHAPDCTVSCECMNTVNITLSLNLGILEQYTTLTVEDGCRSCKPGWAQDPNDPLYLLTGTKTCTININECDPDPCQNSGTCHDQENGYTCECHNGYIGDQCETNGAAGGETGSVPGGEI